ncbi:MAG: multiple sugar transport system permease protein [Gaiellaceae bacterium]|nr:multiple sugar transport system permease protein [Gaiellaceae bacterium]
MSQVEAFQSPTAMPVPPVASEPRRRLRMTRLKAAFFSLLVVGLSILFVYPFIWAVSASLKPQAEVFDNRVIPKHWAFHNYVDVFQIPDAPMLTWIWNTIWISTVGALAVTFSSALIAFGFAYFRFPGRNLLFGVLLATMMLPPQVTMIPTYLIWKKFGLINHGGQYPLWVPNLFGSAFYVFLQRQFFLSIPRDYFEAARMDGDNYWTMFWRIAVPLAKPALIVTFIFEIEAKWFDLMTPLIYLRDTALFTLPLGLKTILDSFGRSGGGEGDWQLIVAATVISVIPMLVIFAVFQKYFLEGISTQGRKG